MIRTVIRTTLVASLAAGGMIALTAIPASAAKVTIVAGAGSSASCTTNASSKLAPALKDDWVASPSDSVPAVAALPNTQFASAGPVVTSAKGTGTCSGTATDGTNAAPIVGIKKLTVATDPANPGSSAEATCSALIAGGGSTALFNTTIEWSSGNGDSIANTTITDSTLTMDLSPLGFEFTGGTSAGSFAGGTFTSVSPVTSGLIAEVTQAQETGAQAVADSYTSLGCQPTLKVKTNSHGTTASLKGPKGLKAIVITGGSLTASA